jgi:hypothetical protein
MSKFKRIKIIRSKEEQKVVEAQARHNSFEAPPTLPSYRHSPVRKKKCRQS